MRSSHRAQLGTIAAVLVLFGASPAAAGGLKQAPGGKFTYGSGGTMRIEVTSITVINPYASAALKHGDTATVKAKIKNTGTALAATVPWTIDVNVKQTTPPSTATSAAIGSGSLTNLAVGEEREVSATWNARRGWYDVGAYVHDVVGNTAPAAKQTMTTNYTVAATLATTDLNFLTAESKGVLDVVTLPGDCTKGVDRSQPHVRFVTVECPTGKTTSGTWTHLQGYWLGGGWYVKSAVVEKLSYSTGFSAASLQSTGNSSSGRAETVVSASVSPGAKLRWKLLIHIEGPSDTSP